MPKIFQAGKSVDATFTIAHADAWGFVLLFESRSGTRNTAAARNTQYEAGLELLLARAFELGATITKISLSPRNKEQLTELVVPAYPFPWDRAGTYSVHGLRVALGRAQAGTSRAPNAKGGGNHSKRLQIVCQAELTASRQELERLLSGAELSAKTLASIVGELERRASSYRIGDLQRIRRKKMGKPLAASTPSPAIFGDLRTCDYGPYVHHRGGRSELQFNLGIEPDGRELRFGVAFSFEPSQYMHYAKLEETLIPKVARFNEIIRRNYELVSDLRMWYEGKNVRIGPDEFPAPIPYARTGPGVFIFLGSRQQLEALDCGIILSCLDRLLDLYLQIEIGYPFANAVQAFAPRFSFEPKDWKERAVQTTLTPNQQALDVCLRHNEIQKVLHGSLVLRYGKAFVDYEVKCHYDSRVDVVLRVKDEYWLYEIKTAGSPRHCIREAIGQLLEYAYWPGAPPVSRLVVVGESVLDSDSRAYLESLRARFSLPIDYEQIQCGLAPLGGNALFV